ncbi:unnamed protein product [Parajaminaea phylloscopi]
MSRPDPARSSPRGVFARPQSQMAMARQALSKGTEAFAALVWGTAAVLFVYSAGNWLYAVSQVKGGRRDPRQPADPRTSGSEEPQAVEAKPWHESVVQVTYPTDSTMCEYPFVIGANTSRRRPLIRAGALLRLVDIVAGVAARRHAGQGCVTVSLDSVLFLSPIHLGDLIHLSASVNRSFTSSMEIGVRVTKEDPIQPGELTYVSHAYFTFVVRRSDSSSRSASSKAQQLRAPRVPDLRPQSHLQWRRHFLAGHRRSKRLAAVTKGQCEDGLTIEVRDRCRLAVVSLSQANETFRREEACVDDGKIAQIERELLARALFEGADEGLSVKVTPDGTVQACVRGDDGGSTLRHRLSDIEQVAAELRHSPRYRLGTAAARDETSADTAPKAWLDADSPRPVVRRCQHEGERRLELTAEDTVAHTLHIVFPQHANSFSILFGGQTMQWMEQAALMSARHLLTGHKGTGGTKLSWRTVAMDGLEFKRPVAIGEAMTFTAICLTSFTTSCEVYVVASVEKQGNERDTGDSHLAAGSQHFTNDALFTLALLDAGQESDNTRPSRSEPLLPALCSTDGSALAQLAAASHRRRARRLELREMLMRTYVDKGTSHDVESPRQARTSSRSPEGDD